jgi:hypothetical protein
MPATRLPVLPSAAAAPGVGMVAGSLGAWPLSVAVHRCHRKGLAVGSPLTACRDAGRMPRRLAAQPRALLPPLLPASIRIAAMDRYQRVPVPREPEEHAENEVWGGRARRGWGGQGQDP